MKFTIYVLLTLQTHHKCTKFGKDWPTNTLVGNQDAKLLMNNYGHYI